MSWDATWASARSSVRWATGTAGAGDGVPRLQDDVWKMAVATVKEPAAAAEANNATVLLEPIYRSVLASAKRTRLFLEEVGSQRVRAQLDGEPAGGERPGGDVRSASAVDRGIHARIASTTSPLECGWQGAT